MVAAGVLQLVEDGLVGLDDPVTDYVPELELAEPWQAGQITVRQLLTHTTGFPDQVFDLGPVTDDALSDWAASQGETFLHAPPGSFYNYSNPNYSLAGLVIERASGMTYRDYLADRLWGPAGLDSMTFDPWQAVATGDFATGYYVDLRTGDLGPITLSQSDSGWIGPAGLALSDAGDLVRWARLLMEGGGPVLTPSSAAAMQAPQVWMHQTPALYYGYGIIHETYPEIGFRWHDGSWIGWGSIVMWQPESRFAVAVLSNTSTPLIGAAGCILESALELPDVEVPDLSTDAETWRRYPGQFAFTDVNGGAISVGVSLHGDQLLLDAGPGSYVIPEGRFPLQQGFLDTFYADLDGDGEAETDLTFIGGSTGSTPTMWLRYRYAVGTRANPVRRPSGRMLAP
jgi:CubicO group peptidase (beta-lactamase class C family)